MFEYYLPNGELIEDYALFVKSKKEPLFQEVKQLNIYTDGCHFKHTSKDLGIGAYLLYNGREYSLSIKVDAKLLLEYGISATECSNPTAEFLAVAEVLKRIQGKEFSPNTILKFYSDFVGVQKWINGEWKAKKPYIVKIRDTIQEIQHYLFHEKMVICEYEHVKGHSGVLGNEKADKLANLMDGTDTFSTL